MNSSGFSLSNPIGSKCHYPEGRTLNMQVTKSSMGYSSSRPETQGVDRSTGTNAHVFSHLGLSFEGLRPGKKPLSCRAIICQEKVKPVLPIVGESGFKITKNRPEPIPDRLVIYENTVLEISECYKCGKFDAALRKASMLLEVIPRTPENNDFVQYVNTITFLCHIMKDMSLCLHLPANDSEEFINWQLRIADLASKETTDLPASSKLVLYNLRWAADAGNLEARRWLAKAMLFAGACRGMPSTNIHFFPVEALEHLEHMARSGAPLPAAENDQDLAINKMVELIKLRNANERERDRIRDELVDFLCKQPDPEMQIVVPLVYIGEPFGPLCRSKVKEFLRQFYDSCQGKEFSLYITNLYKYWGVIYSMSAKDFDMDYVVKEFNKLARDGLLVALYQLSELFIERGSRLFEYIKQFIECPDPVFLEYPYLTHSLYNCYSVSVDSFGVSSKTSESDKQKQSPCKRAVKKKRQHAQPKGATELADCNKEQLRKKIDGNTLVLLNTCMIQGLSLIHI